MPESREAMPTVATESQIRRQLRLSLSADVPAQTLVEELPLDGGAARIDMATIGTTLAGYEIKGDADSFARMSNQIHAYNRVFDEIWIVVGSSLKGEAASVVPSWWGIISAVNSPSGLTLDLVRPASENPRQEPYSIATLLTPTEAADMLSGVELEVPKKASRRLLWEKVAETFSIDQIRTAALTSMSRRYAKASTV